MPKAFQIAATFALVELNKASMRRRGPNHRNKFRRSGNKIAVICVATISKPDLMELIIPGGGGRFSILETFITY
jgi:hypothetical protein